METVKSVWWIVITALSSWIGYVHMSRPSKGECYARHKGIETRFDDLKDHIDTRFDDIKELINGKTIKKKAKKR